MSNATQPVPMDDWDDEFLRLTCWILRNLRDGPRGFNRSLRHVVEYLADADRVEFVDDGTILHVRKVCR